jgi:hypothetical protein
MKRRSDIYRLKSAEREIFDQSRTDPSVFSGFYFQGANTGTWATAEDKDSRNIALYKTLMKRWQKLDKPRTFEYAYDSDSIPGLIMPSYPCEVRTQFSFGSSIPRFLVNHGFVFQDFQTEWITAEQKTRVIVGAYGCGKTITAIAEMLIYAATLPGFEGIVLAPYSYQSTAVFNKAVNDLIRGTRYEERFLDKTIAKTPEQLYITNDFVGQSHIYFIPILDKATKILNLEGDMGIVDQTEQLPDIPEVRRSLSSRLRGNYQGRDRLGIINWLANPYDNPELWDFFDEGAERPEYVYARQIQSYDNKAITEEQLREWEQGFARDEQSKNVYLKGARPVGEGRQFPGTSLEKCRAQWLDDKMESGLASKTEGYTREETGRVGVYRWEMPYEEDHVYFEIADPGYANPPRRNAAVVGVWDITDFPDTPAFLVAFNWVFGNNSPLPWMQVFADYAHRYHCVGRCAYDSTGAQSGYDKLVELFNDLLSEGLNMSSAKKSEYVNFAKTMMAKGLIQFPTIAGIVSQLMKYDVPDTNISQDIVMMIAMTCGRLEEYFYLSQREDMQDLAVTRDYRPRAVWRGGRVAARRR